MLNPPEREQYGVGGKLIEFGVKLLKPLNKGQKEVKKATEAQAVYKKGQGKAALATTATLGVGDFIYSNISEDELPSIMEKAEAADIPLKVIDERINPEDYPVYKKGSDSAKAFRQAQRDAKKAGADFFTFEGRSYNTREKKAEGSEMESFETTRTREAAIEKDERERRERMMKAEAKRLGISEERLKEIMLEREQAEMDRKMQEAAERQSRASLLVGGQTKLDANKDGDITAEDFSMLRDRKAEGSLTKEELEDGTYDVQRLEGDDFKSITMSRPLREDEGGFTDKELQEYRERMALFDKLAEPYIKAGKPIPKKINDLSLGEVPPSLVRGMERSGKAEGSMLVPVEGMPVDTYPNIPEDEMDEALASQLPDAEMEEDYIEFIMDESLSDSEQDYLAGVLQQDNRLSDILDKVITTASEFSGAGEVEGPGTGVSDSIPARLSDGEFVFTKKATDQIGADALQRMMDDAERAYDGGYQMKAVGGMMEDEDPESLGMSQTQEEIEKLMMGANRMPSLQ